MNYHNLSRVNILYKIIFEIDILNLHETKKIFEAIKIRHKIVHQSGRIEDQRILIRDYSVLYNITILNKWLQNIDSLISSGKPRKNSANYVSRFGNVMNSIYDSGIFDNALQEISDHNILKLDKIFDKLKSKTFYTYKPPITAHRTYGWFSVA